MRIRLACILVFCVTVFGNVRALAWNNIGHMAVAYVAWQNLPVDVQTRTSALIQKNPLYKTWLALIPASVTGTQRDMYLFMIAATWPDQIKSDAKAFPCNGHANTDTPPAGEDAALNGGYSDPCLHKYWHFVDESYAVGGAADQPVPAPNGQMKIDVFGPALGSSEDDLVKSYDLVWLEHLVGDIHQPLHCVARYTGPHPKGDAGGNDVKVTGGELHGYWDDLLGKITKSLYTDALLAEKVGKTLPAADPALAADATSADWVQESLTDAKTVAYKNPPIGPDWGPYKLTTAYHQNAVNIAQQRVSLAGVRLANLIKADLK